MEELIKLAEELGVDVCNLAPIDISVFAADGGFKNKDTDWMQKDLQ